MSNGFSPNVLSPHGTVSSASQSAAPRHRSQKSIESMSELQSQLQTDRSDREDEEFWHKWKAQLEAKKKEDFPQPSPKSISQPASSSAVPPFSAPVAAPAKFGRVMNRVNLKSQDSRRSYADMFAPDTSPMKNFQSLIAQQFSKDEKESSALPSVKKIPLYAVSRPGSRQKAGENDAARYQDPRVKLLLDDSAPVAASPFQTPLPVGYSPAPAASSPMAAFTPASLQHLSLLSGSLASAKPAPDASSPASRLPLSRSRPRSRSRSKSPLAKSERELEFDGDLSELSETEKKAREARAQSKAERLKAHEAELERQKQDRAAAKQAKKKAEEEARAAAEAQERAERQRLLTAEQEAKLAALEAEQARLRAQQEEELRKAHEAADKARAEAAARRAEADRLAREKAEAERLVAEARAEAQRRLEEDERQKAAIAEEARIRKVEEARLAAEQKAAEERREWQRIQAEKAAAEEEMRRQALKADQERMERERLEAEVERLRQLEMQRQQEEAEKRRAEEAERKRLEEERIRIEEEKRIKEEIERRKAEEEMNRIAEEKRKEEENKKSATAAPWINGTHRDALFEFLASEDCTLFSTNVKLNNRNLDSLLVEGGSLEDTLTFLKQINASGQQYASVPELAEALRREKQMAQAPPAVAPSPTAAPWITDQDRDALFEFLASDETNLFSTNVKLSNKALNSLLLEGGSLDQTIAALRSINQTGKQHASVQELAASIKDERERAKAPPPKAAPAPEALALSAAPSSAGPAQVSPSPRAASWITDKDRDELFEFLASDQTNLFSTNVKLNNRSLNALLTEGGSLAATIELLKLIEADQMQFATVPDLVLAMKNKAAAKAQPAPIPVPEPAPVKAPAPAAAPAGPISESDVTDADRDALFNFLAAPECHLFNASVKLSNRNLSKLIVAGRGVQTTVSFVDFLNETCVQYSSVPELITAIEQRAAAASAEQEQLNTFIGSIRDRLFQSPSSVTWVPSDVERLYIDSHAGLLLVEYMRYLIDSGLKFPSFPALSQKLIALHEAVKTLHHNERSDVEMILNAPDANILEGELRLSDVESICQAGRTEGKIEIPSRSPQELQKFQSQGIKFTNANDIVIAIVKAGKPQQTIKPVPTAALAAAPPAEAKMPVSPGSKSRPPAASPADRDALFEFLASEDCQLFSTNVKLNNKSLDSLLAAGGSREATIKICQDLNAQKREFSSVADLVEAVQGISGTTAKVPNLAVKSLDPNSASANGSAAPSPSSGSARAPPPAWITDKDRDALFSFLAEPEHNFFSTNVKLNNRALNSILAEGGSLDSSIEILRRILAEGRSFASVSALVEAVKSAKGQQQPAKSPHSSKAAVPAWITDKHRDSLFEFLASEDCTLFSTNVKLNNRSLNALLTEGGSLDMTLQLLNGIQSAGQQFAAVADLIGAMKSAKGK